MTIKAGADYSLPTVGNKKEVKPTKGTVTIRNK